MAVLMAVLAALMYGSAIAVQHHEAASMDPDQSLRPGLLVGLAKNPLWLLGLVGDAGGFALQTAALAKGSVVLVQPILTSSLVVALLFGSKLDKRRMKRWEWIAAIAAMAGLTIFLLVAHPTSHSTFHPRARVWIALCGGVVLLVAALLWMARRGTLTKRALCIALSAAMGQALMALLSKELGDSLADDVGHTFATWRPYVVIVFGIMNIMLVQSAYQASRPTLTLPVITVVEPLGAMVLGGLFFHEQVSVTGWRAPVVVLALGLTVTSLVTIAWRSPELAIAPPEHKAT